MKNTVISSQNIIAPVYTTINSSMSILPRKPVDATTVPSTPIQAVAAPASSLSSSSSTPATSSAAPQGKSPHPIRKKVAAAAAPLRPVGVPVATSVAVPPAPLPSVFSSLPPPPPPSSVLKGLFDNETDAAAVLVTDFPQSPQPVTATVNESDSSAFPAVSYADFEHLMAQHRVKMLRDFSAVKGEGE
eukprot:gene24876-31265_t